MLLLVLGILIFVGSHLLPTRPEVRSGLAKRFGENAYKAAFSLVALVGLALIVLGYQKVHLTPGKNPLLWAPPVWTRHITFALMLPVFPLLVAAYVPGRITAAVRHPMITAVKFWALAHLLVRGDLASILLFGGLLAWAVVDRISLKRREAAGLVAVKSGPLRNDAVAIGLGLLLFWVFVKWGHPALIGVRIVP